jgi:hypothetical protein
MSSSLAFAATVSATVSADAAAGSTSAANAVNATAIPIFFLIKILLCPPEQAPAVAGLANRKHRKFGSPGSL